MTQDQNVSSAPPIDPAPMGAAPLGGAPLGAAPVGYASPGVVTTDKDAKLWGMLAHLCALGGAIIPFGNIIGPLVIWLIKKNEIPFVDDQGKESLNFQITISIALVVCFILMFLIIGIFLLPIVGILDLVFIIIASIKANNGEAYRYPFAIRLIK